jgi:hypothetical protein
MHVFRREHGSVEWDTIEIPEGGLRVSRAADGALEFTEKNAPGALAAFLLFEENNVQRAALVPGAHTVGVWVNGFRPLGLSILDDGDEVLIEGARLLFGSHEPSEVRVFTADEPQVSCARCHLLLEPGDTVIDCEACPSVHHEGPRARENDEALLCRSVEPECGSCRHTREQVLWRPEDRE